MVAVSDSLFPAATQPRYNTGREFRFRALYLRYILIAAEMVNPNLRQSTDGRFLGPSAK